MFCFNYIFLMFIFASVAHGHDSFYFKVQPSDTRVVTGKSVTLYCEVSHQGSMVYYWSLNDTRLVNTARRRQIGSNLFISRADRLKDEGEYVCVAENTTSSYSTVSNTAKVEVLWLGIPSVELVSPDTDVHNGDDLVLRCNVGGSGDIKYEWLRNNEKLTKTDRIIPKQKKLHIKSVNYYDNGVYRCLAYNEVDSSYSQDNYVLQLNNEAGPQLKKLPESQLVKKGGIAVFECLFVYADDVKWYFNNEGVVKNSTRFMSYPNGTLIIYNVKNMDEGLYTCEGKRLTNSVELKEAYSAYLNISYIKELTSSSFEPPFLEGSVIVPERKPFELICIPPAGSPPPRVSWYRPDGSVLDSEGSIRQNENSLVLDYPSMSTDSGAYVCVADNSAGATNFTVHVLVSNQPIIRSNPTDVSADEDATISFQCLYKATPPPATTVKWRKDGRLINENNNTIFSRNVLGNSTLVIKQVQASERGIYRCEVNTTGFKLLASDTAVLHVREKLKFSPKPVSKKLELGISAKISCKAQGTPPPIIKWFKEPDRKLEFPSHIQDINGTLMFKKTKSEDKGRYTCIATSTQGTISATVDIDVIVAPRFRVSPQNLTEVYEGSPVIIHCMADGDPQPTIKWDKEGKIIALDQDRFRVLENGSLLIQRVFMEDRGKYGCTAGNSGGLKRAEIILVVRSMDGEMEELEEGSMMTKTVTITLSAATAYMLLVIGLMVWCRYRRQKRKQAYLNAYPEGILLAKAENGDTIAANEKTETDKIRHDGAETTQSQSSGQSKRSLKNNYDKLAFPRQNLQNLKLLGNGMFGEVLTTDCHDPPILVKALQHTREESVLVEFKRELDMFNRLTHENIVRLVGVCREAEPHYMLLEHTDWGDLKRFLQSTKKERSKLTLRQIIDIAKQISLGMECLSNARLMHKDLSARNCVISSELKVKISSLSLIKDVHHKDYFQIHNQMLPIRWLPYEAVFDDDFSTKSDVYSFAVLCWELFHHGERPYHNISDHEVVEKLKNKDLILKSPKHAPSKMISLFSNCLSMSPNVRPTFSRIAIILGEILDSL